ncbi:DEAD/DEAH box helicase [Sandaracinus amylolyticus]|uniref:DEAD/DEAH box helicase n=1 Tax=Sandaracinus amylolyticus TaxID=927083 RepID=UPI001F449F5A|nr:DEAD/DEAH box helicase [Sandaracinus amylolyticus]
MQFRDLGLSAPLLRAIEQTGYETPTPIQREAIPPAITGRDVLGCAQTGTGKTAAFALPLLQRLDGSAGDEPKLRALVLTPTRELAIQIGDSFTTYGKGLDLWHTVIFGGVNEKPQIAELRDGVDALIATPGRLLDLMNQGHVRLSDVEIFVLDEADRMLDMGFLPDVKRVIAKLPRERQTLFFSATMPPDIRALADSLLRDPVSVAVTPVSSTAERIDQQVYFVDKGNKPRLLVELLKKDPAIEHTLVFTRTKHGANKVVQQLEKAGLKAAAIHGNKSQNARERAMTGFRTGELRLLVATDIAARGIDVEGITHVINYDLPNIPETYVHRIGRTGRAGAAGIAISFCESEERPYLVDIERLIGKHVPRVEQHAYPPSEALPPMTDLARRGGGGGGARPAQRPSGGGGGGRPQHARGGGPSRGQSHGGGQSRGQAPSRGQGPIVERVSRGQGDGGRGPIVERKVERGPAVERGAAAEGAPEGGGGRRKRRRGGRGRRPGGPRPEAQGAPTR